MEIIRISSDSKKVRIRILSNISVEEEKPEKGRSVMQVLMCVPNISEGKDVKLVEKIAAAVKSTEKVKLLEVSSDRDHNRSVFGYLGEPDQVLEATKKLINMTIEGIDMTMHRGDHPRMGAVDVVPFIPIRNVTGEDALKIAQECGAFLGDKKVPVYFYEDAASVPDRKNLADIRKGQYEALATKLKDPLWAPDCGPAQFNPKSGATAVGVRFPLIAFNVNLNTSNLEIADKIARGVRNLNGGYRFVRAIGVNLSELGLVQVSMNLTNFKKTPIHRVMETIRSEATSYGVTIASTEFVGPVPLDALEEIMKFYLQAHDFSVSQIIETYLLG
jgi:glutamate formiminotransferase / 5-formyltetrahydrofolate cyclo-ligase